LLLSRLLLFLAELGFLGELGFVPDKNAAGVEDRPEYHGEEHGDGFQDVEICLVRGELDVALSTREFDKTINDAKLNGRVSF
jgi:hypothetical protein